MKKHKQFSPKVKKRAAIEPTALRIDRVASKLRHERSSSTTSACPAHSAISCLTALNNAIISNATRNIQKPDHATLTNLLSQFPGQPGY